MIRREAVTGVIVLGLLLWLTQISRAVAADDLGALKKEVEALKEGQTALQKQLDEIKNLLTRGAQPATIRAPKSADVAGSLIGIDGAPFKGEATAKVTVVEFTDYQCPFCGAHARDTFPQINRDYIETGKVKYVLRDMPIESIHPLAFKAAEAAHCAADQNKYWEMHDRIFASQNALGIENLKAHARAIGLDVTVFAQCISSGKHSARIRKDLADAQRLRVTGTPTFFLGLTDPTGAPIKPIRKLTGASGYPTFKQAIESLLTSAD